jgi:hypothetical protein
MEDRRPEGQKKDRRKNLFCPSNSSMTSNRKDRRTEEYTK